MLDLFSLSPESLETLARPLAAAEDALARLDERLTTSPIRDGWQNRTHFSDACASLWLEGELVTLEDLVLHDAAMDVRTPTHELVRAHDVLRARRRIAAAKPGWALTAPGLDSLRGRTPARPAGATENRAREGRGQDLDLEDAIGAEEAWFDAELAAIDALIARRPETRNVEPAPPPAVRDSALYDPDWDEEERLKQWRETLPLFDARPPVLAAAFAAIAWNELAPLEHRPWLGHLAVADYLRARNKTRAHLLCLDSGLRGVARDRRLAREAGPRAGAFVAAIQLAADEGLRDHDRWLTAARLLERKLAGKRSNSKLPLLIRLVISRPAVSTGIIARELGITKRAAQDLVTELDLREITGRGRYRAWAVL